MGGVEMRVSAVNVVSAHALHCRTLRIFQYILVQKKFTRFSFYYQQLITYPVHQNLTTIHQNLTTIHQNLTRSATVMSEVLVNCIHWLHICPMLTANHRHCCFSITQNQKIHQNLTADSQALSGPTTYLWRRYRGSTPSCITVIVQPGRWPICSSASRRRDLRIDWVLASSASSK